jgi:hypothetical protein
MNPPFHIIALLSQSSVSRTSKRLLDGIHRAFPFFGVLTVFSTLVYRTLKAGDGSDLRHQRSVHPGG